MPRKYRTVDTASAFIGWGEKGQAVELEVVTYDPTGATTPNGKVVPRVVGTLVEDCDNYKNLRGGSPTKARLRAGEQVTVDGSVENLRKGLMIANPARGDFLRLTFTDTYDTREGEGKVITVEHAPAASGVKEDDL
jgi:hypothetical protein